LLVVIVFISKRYTFRESCVMSFWNTIGQEIREVAWLASVVGGLSMLGVGLAVIVAMA
jgi:hypothetical protein